ncbi:hypothetical protein C8R45DRAFT_1171789 [Mycena sanguinolenta]|nr:hypothetical protein C8R45DRAFT_1171789 [Mycena sanguinolenta]
MPSSCGSPSIGPLRAASSFLYFSIPSMGRRHACPRYEEDEKTTRATTTRIISGCGIMCASLALLPSAFVLGELTNAQEHPRPRTHGRPRPVLLVLHFRCLTSSPRPPPAAVLQPAMCILKCPSPSNTPAPAYIRRQSRLSHVASRFCNPTTLWQVSRVALPRLDALLSHWSV